ncbi:MAG: prolyl oligopeptidase family serine peptidase [Geminicoccaceae bacterium]
MASIDPRPTLDAPDDDPYLWLEEIDGKASLDWVEKQHQATLVRFGDAAFEVERDTLTTIFDRPDRIAYVNRRGDFLYNTWIDADNPRGLVRRTTMASYCTNDPDWEVLLNLDALAEAEGEDWIWAGAATLPPDHDRAILRLSRGGSDAVVLREFDVAMRCEVEGGFALPEAKGGIDWLDRDHLLLFSAHGGGDMETASGYSRTVRLWRRGEPAENASILFETDAANMAAWADVDRTTGEEQIWYAEKLDFFNTRWWLGDRNGPKTMIDLPTDAWFDTERGWLAVRPRQSWTVGGKTYAPDTLLGISFSSFLDGNRDFQVLFEAGERRSLDGFYWCGQRLVVSILDDLVSVYEYWTPVDTGWHQETQTDLPTIGVASVWQLDNHAHESNGDLVGTVETPLSPPTFSLLEPGKAPVILKEAPAIFDPSRLTTTRHEAISADGERIPYIQTGPTKETGDEPVHLTAYGGFGHPQLPGYRGAFGKIWLERGGIGVVANIRGGGEFGTAWHDAGRRENKPSSHDDFAAVAADLVRRGVTRPERIAAEGGSNGGILITNMLTRYPERFGGLFCTIPLVDMRRYTKLLAGASWIAEYGDPDVEEDWSFLQHYSAYHTAKPGQNYPPILLATTRRDDRVHPGHARKMAAKLQAMGYEAHFYEPAAGGHGYGKDNSERDAFIALGFNFMRQAIGWTRDGDG